MKTSGVYAIYLTGTRYVYIGESANVAARWRTHANSWVWPSPAEYVVVRAMPGSHEKERQRVENALHRLLRRQGYCLLSNPVQENEERLRSRGRAVAAGIARLSPEERRRRSAAGLAASSRLSPAEKSARTKKAHETRKARGNSIHDLTAAQRSARMKKAWETRRKKAGQAALP